MNKPPRKIGILSFYYLSVSLLGLCLLAILTFKIPTSMENLTLQKQFTGSVFGAICILGIIAGISPSRCSRTLHFKADQDKSSHKTKKANMEEATLRFKGHHPTCGKFSPHVLQFGDKTYCSGCTGLIIGAMISLLGSSLYFFAGFHVGEASILVFWLGFVGVTFGLLQYHILNPNKAVVHFSLNVIFVLGAFLLLVGVEEINSSFVLEFYLLALIVFWIITRISLSQLEHKKICATCDLESCSFSFN